MFHDLFHLAVRLSGLVLGVVLALAVVPAL